MSSASRSLLKDILSRKSYLVLCSLTISQWPARKHDGEFMHLLPTYHLTLASGIFLKVQNTEVRSKASDHLQALYIYKKGQVPRLANYSPSGLLATLSELISRMSVYCTLLHTCTRGGPRTSTERYSCFDISSSGLEFQIIWLKSK